MAECLACGREAGPNRIYCNDSCLCLARNRSLHEETCSDARKLAHEIHNDVLAGEEEIAKAIDAGFRFRELHQWQDERILRLKAEARIKELLDKNAVLTAQVVALQGRLENSRRKP
jgi:hypothetical protein